MAKARHITLEGKPGSWVALDDRTGRVVAQAGTLRALKKKAEHLGVKNPTFAVVPKKDCALIL
jgi:hypothetical protein